MLWKLLAWTVLAVLTMMFVVVADGVMTSAMVEKPTTVNLASLSETTEGLKDGDDIRARFLATARTSPPGP